MTIDMHDDPRRTSARLVDRARSTRRRCPPLPPRFLTTHTSINKTCKQAQHASTRAQRQSLRVPHEPPTSQLSHFTSAYPRRASRASHAVSRPLYLGQTLAQKAAARHMQRPSAAAHCTPTKSATDLESCRAGAPHQTARPLKTMRARARPILPSRRRGTRQRPARPRASTRKLPPPGPTACRYIV